MNKLNQQRLVGGSNGSNTSFSDLQEECRKAMRRCSLSSIPTKSESVEYEEATMSLSSSLHNPSRSNANFFRSQKPIHRSSHYSVAHNIPCLAVSDCSGHTAKSRSTNYDSFNFLDQSQDSFTYDDNPIAATEEITNLASTPYSPSSDDRDYDDFVSPPENVESRFCNDVHLNGTQNTPIKEIDVPLNISNNESSKIIPDIKTMKKSEFDALLSGIQRRTKNIDALHNSSTHSFKRTGVGRQSSAELLIHDAKVFVPSTERINKVQHFADIKIEGNLSQSSHDTDKNILGFQNQIRESKTHDKYVDINNTTDHSRRSLKRYESLEVPVIEISPGVFVRHLTYEEMKDAFRNLLLTECKCICCGTSLFYVQTASHVLCSLCQSVCPTDINNSSPIHSKSIMSGSAACTGMTIQDLQEMKQRIAQS